MLCPRIDALGRRGDLGGNEGATDSDGKRPRLSSGGRAYRDATEIVPGSAFNLRHCPRTHAPSGRKNCPERTELLLGTERQWSHCGSAKGSPGIPPRDAKFIAARHSSLGGKFGDQMSRAPAVTKLPHLEEISSDRAGWHQTGGKLRVPRNISLLHLPPYSPELNPAENIWQFLRQNHLSNRVFESYTDIVDAYCAAWNAVVSEPKRVPSNSHQRPPR
jgi:DDE superfamily endonuclease